MNSTTDRLRPRSTTALALVAFGVLGLLAACSSNSNPSPSGPVIDIDRPSVGGNGGRGGATANDNDAGESSVGGSRAGSGNSRAGAANGGSDSGNAGEGGASGEGGETGEAGTGPIAPGCPSTDLGFLNRPSSSQKAPFDNAKRLGAQATVPPLP